MPNELREHVRDDEGPPGGPSVVVVRGGPDNVKKLAEHAARTNRAFELDGQPVWGVSVFLALDEIGEASLDGLLARRLSTYREVHLPRLIDVRDAGFDVLPTFGRPHFSLTIPDIEPETLDRLLAALGPATENPYHERRPRP
jgi:hypothetical protein